MSKEIYISSTPHETRLAIVENDALTEIYYERENEYTLAGSIYNGKVTRVLPGMQSSFVDIGLERDAFLYITDFMEEAPDSAEFDTSHIGENGSRAPRLEASAEGQRPESQRTEGQRSEGRGERSGRGRRGRGDRGDRNPDRQAPTDPNSPEFNSADAPRMTPLASTSIEAPTEATDGAEIGEGAPGADGSRRWRGRRGRRRGRGPREGAAQTSSQENGQTIYPAEAEAESVEDFTSNLYAEDSTVSTVDLDNSSDQIAAAPIASEPQQTYDESRRQSRGDRNDRGDRGDRNGRGDRGGRGNDRGGRNDRSARSPRGFSPSHSQYGVADEAPDGPVGEPIILPGESLSKYRKGEEAPAAAKPEGTILTPLPASEYTISPGWDGGATLPGESLSRHRRAETRSEPRAEHRSDSRANFTAPTPTQQPVATHAEVIQEEDGPSVAETPEQQPEVALAAYPEQVPEAEILHESVAAPTPSAEYEPEEASASYRVDPAPPSEFRQSAPVLESQEEPVEEIQAEVIPAPETTFGHTHTFTPEPAAPAASELHAEADPIEAHVQQQAERIHDAQDAHEHPSEAIPAHDITTLSATGEMHSEPHTIEPAPQEQDEEFDEA